MVLEAWIEKCPKKGADIRYSECKECEDYVKVDCIYIVCGHKGYAKRRFKYRELK